MIRLALTALFLASAEAAAVINPRSTPDGLEKIRAIEEQIRAANRIDSAVLRAEDALAQAKTEKEPESVLHQLELAAERERDKQRAAYTKAIHMTLDAYDLHPPVRTGTSVMPHTRGRVIEWLPIAHERAAREVRAADGSVTRVPQPRMDLAGAAYPDGVVFIDPSTFKHPAGVGYLASTLLHERTHFEQYITAGRGDAMTVAEAQREAYGAEMKYSSYFFDASIPIQKAASDEIDARWTEEDAKVKARERRGRTLIGRLKNWYEPETLSTVFEGKPRTIEELDAIKRDAARLRAEIAEENAKRAQARLYSTATLVPGRAGESHSSGSIPNSQARPPLMVPSRASDRPILSAPFVEPSRTELVCRMVDSVCVGDWSRAHFASYHGLTRNDLDRLQTVVSRVAPGCSRSLLERIIAMRLSGAPLDLTRLQAETAAFAPSSGPIFQEDPPARNGRDIPSRVPDRLDGPAMRELRGLPR